MLKEESGTQEATIITNYSYKFRTTSQISSLLFLQFFFYS